MNNHVTTLAGIPESLRIVVATDLQPRSDISLRRAIALANGIGAKLSLVHAVPKSPKLKMRSWKNFAYAQMLSAVDEATIGPRPELIDIDVRVGKPLDVITSAARDANADLIVIAAPQARRLDSILGTTAERLIRAAQRPVLVVHREVQDVYRSAAVATDLSASSMSMIQTAARFGIFEQMHTTLLHAFDPPYAGMMRSVGVEDAEIKRYYRDWGDELDVRARRALAAAGVAAHNAHVIVQPNHPERAIRRMLEQQQPELLVIGASRWFLTKRLLLGSVADHVLRTALCDVLVIPNKLGKAYMSRVRRTFPNPEALSIRESSRYG